MTNDAAPKSEPNEAADEAEVAKADVRLEMPELYRWQFDAIASWLSCGRHGVVEAVTGSGKTNMALSVIADAYQRGRFILVVVPSRVLIEQWYERLSEALPELRIGRLGDNYRDRPADCDILITTRHSAASRQPKPPNKDGGLLIADEVHGFAGGVLRKALMRDYDERLGLTATLERSDDGVEKILLPFFGGICFRYDFVKAIADGVCAQPRVGFVAVPLTKEERVDYVSTEEELVTARAVLRGIPNMPIGHFGEFLAAVNYLAENDGGPHGTAANNYLNAFSKRREIVAASTAKYEALGRFAPSIANADGTLIFTETVRAANHAVNRLDVEVGIEIITGSTPRKERGRILEQLRDGTIDAVAAPRVLDEGIDVPNANLGIVVSASRTRRQMVQRMGRILRRKEIGKGARFVIIFARDTLEDPTTNEERDGFLEEIELISESARVFDSTDVNELASFLDYSGPEEVIEPQRVPPEEVLDALNGGVVVGDVEESEELPYVEIDVIDLPELSKAKPKKKRLSTGESPVTVQPVGDKWVMQCTGCGAASEPVAFRFEALDATVECNCF